MTQFFALSCGSARTSKVVLTSIIAVFWLILVSVPLSATALAATASFVKTDATTMGSWIGAYGADGYFVSRIPTPRSLATPRSPSAGKPTGHGRLPRLLCLP